MPIAFRDQRSNNQTEQMISITAPLYNEQESVAPLVSAVREAMRAVPDWELVLVDDASVDATADVVAAIAAEDPRIRLVRLARNYGQATAMQAGFDAARGDLVVSMDGDLQNDPRDIPRLISKLNEGYDLVTGYREKRQDKAITRKLPSWIANRIIRRITGVNIRDNGCSLKVYRREVLERVSLYSDMHRFIPAIAAATAGARIAEIPVRHHARQFGKSKYGLSRVAKVLADLTTIKMIRSYRDRPLLLFGTGAGICLLMSFLAAAAAVALRFGGSASRAHIVLPGISLLWFGLAAYLLMLGVISESVLRAQYEPGKGLSVIGREVKP